MARIQSKTNPALYRAQLHDIFQDGTDKRFEEFDPTYQEWCDTLERGTKGARDIFFAELSAYLGSVMLANPNEADAEKRIDVALKAADTAMKDSIDNDGIRAMVLGTALNLKRDINPENFVDGELKGREHSAASLIAARGHNHLLLKIAGHGANFDGDRNGESLAATAGAHGHEQTAALAQKMAIIREFVGRHTPPRETLEEYYTALCQNMAYMANRVEVLMTVNKDADLRDPELWGKFAANLGNQMDVGAYAGKHSLRYESRDLAQMCRDVALAGTEKKKTNLSPAALDKLRPGERKV